MKTNAANIATAFITKAELLCYHTKHSHLNLNNIPSSKEPELTRQPIFFCFIGLPNFLTYGAPLHYLRTEVSSQKSLNDEMLKKPQRANPQIIEVERIFHKVKQPVYKLLYHWAIVANSQQLIQVHVG